MSTTTTHAVYDTPALIGILDAPATAMARGVAVVQAAGTIALAGVGVVPYGFLMNEVTLDGPTLEQLQFVPEAVEDEVKVSSGKIQITSFRDGVEYELVGNIKSGTTFAVGDLVLVAANGEFTNDAGKTGAGEKYIGKVTAIDLLVGGQSSGIRFKATTDGSVTT